MVTKEILFSSRRQLKTVLLLDYVEGQRRLAMAALLGVASVCSARASAVTTGRIGHCWHDDLGVAN